jgi:hypothetical protein
MSLIVGRVCLREPASVDEAAGTLSVSGREPWAVTGRDNVLATHEAILGLAGSLVPVQWGVKGERDGYYTVTSATSALTDLAGYSGYADWKLSMVRHGGDNVIDLESRLAGAIRQNDFALTGERWHAPAIGHYGYYTGSTSPSTMTRTGADGVMTIYRAIPANVSPRWGCAVGDYLQGGVRILAGFPQRTITGLAAAVPPDQWEVSNGLVRVRRLFTGASIEVSSYTGGAWRPKLWQIDIGAGAITGWDSATILRNDPECCILRITESRSPGRVTVDLTIRRGSRIVELYVQRGDSGSISVYLASAAAMTDGTSYLQQTADDADGNKATCGSARNFDLHASGGMTKTATTWMDCYVGVVVAGNSAVPGDEAWKLRDQYLAALPEIVAAVRR